MVVLGVTELGGRLFEDCNELIIAQRTYYLAFIEVEIVLEEWSFVGTLVLLSPRYKTALTT